MDTRHSLPTELVKSKKLDQTEDWWWIPGNINVADIITRGATPKDLQEDTAWQNGAEFLKQPLEEWPIKSAGDIATDARDSVNKLQRKSFSAVMTRAEGKRVLETAQKGIKDKESKVKTIPILCSSKAEIDSIKRPCDDFAKRIQTGSVVKNLLNVKKFSSLSRLVGVTAWVKRVIYKWIDLKDKATKQSKVETLSLNTRPEMPALTVKEREDAFRDLCMMAQEEVTFPNTTLNRLVVFKDEDCGLLLCGGRIQSFSEEKAAVPILPNEAWISTLLAYEAHSANHEGVAGTLLRMREKAWVVKGRRIVTKIVDSCVTCRKVRARQCQQIMSDLPLERTGPAAPFEFTTMDLFGPYEVKDEVKRRVKLKVWGIVFSCMASRAIHADIVSDMSAEGFLLAYQRFTSLRGHP